MVLGNDPKAPPPPFPSNKRYRWQLSSLMKPSKRWKAYRNNSLLAERHEWFFCIFVFLFLQSATGDVWRILFTCVKVRAQIVVCAASAEFCTLASWVLTSKLCIRKVKTEILLIPQVYGGKQEALQRMTCSGSHEDIMNEFLCNFTAFWDMVQQDGQAMIVLESIALSNEFQEDDTFLPHSADPWMFAWFQEAFVSIRTKPLFQLSPWRDVGCWGLLSTLGMWQCSTHSLLARVDLHRSNL